MIHESQSDADDGDDENTEAQDDRVNNSTMTIPLTTTVRQRPNQLMQLLPSAKCCVSCVTA